MSSFRPRGEVSLIKSMLVLTQSWPIAELCLQIMPLSLTGCVVAESVSELSVSRLSPAKCVSVLVTVTESHKGGLGLALSFTGVTLWLLDPVCLMRASQW